MGLQKIRYTLIEISYVKGAGILNICVRYLILDLILLVKRREKNIKQCIQMRYT